MTDVAAAAETVREGGLVVYPTETVYGLAADALDADAVERVFAVKGRSHEKPISLAVPTVEAALAHTEPTEREQRFMDEFLPGPVTVLVEAGPEVPDVLTAGRSRVGVRVPDQPVAQELLEQSGPATSTSANVSGQPSARRVAEIGESVRTACGAVLDDGECPGTESSVVDVSSGTIHRRGARVADIEAWLD
ncbi:Sua5/YciO/YrdC/YwlC family protein [Halococcus morrhuae DSM 1307]|uniref:L-threonylcarbamoyladenylate synthase n=1 Tax=Halococcus morrhuae DSM 1307 TaxID=931277 RepID=M0N5D1_HALMO|nr:L-threonylcarbamoyladenylate synthase [Halococcus morrhuae]EMA52334.1 Sua5/YciO/YrdC/YwlC family protein [Halococcus morrhuae DSM 1307]